MRIKVAVYMALTLALIAGSAVMSTSFAQGKKNKMESKNTNNIEGKVGRVEKDTITVLVGSAPKPIMFNGDTKFLMGHTTDNKPGSVGAIKQGDYISCTVAKDAKSNMVATECLYRDKQ